MVVVVGAGRVCFYKEERRMLDSFRWGMLVMEGYRYRLIRGVECVLDARGGIGREGGWGWGVKLMIWNLYIWYFGMTWPK